MLLSQWRSSLKNWLESRTEIDTWDIVAPDVNQMSGLLPPLESIEFRETDNDLIEATGQQDIYLRKRYSGNPKYEDLPIAPLEGFYASIALRLIKHYQSIHPELLRLDMERLGNPIVIEETGNGDFVVTLHFRVEIAWVVETELNLPLDPPFDLEKITLSVWRQKGEGFKADDRTLDYRLRKNA